MVDRFSQKVVIVTGAAGDIGRCTSQRFADEGARLVLVDADGPAVELMAATLGADTCIAVCADVTVEAEVAAYVAAARQAFGGVDILFNNAGIESEVCDISECDLADYERVMAVNVRGVMLGMKHVVPALRERGGGSIVNTASVAGLSGSAGFSTYCASKHAVIGLTRSVAIQQGPHNIRVNAVCPSATEGRMMNSIEGRMVPDDPATAQGLVTASIPLGRYAQPADIASLVTYLCSDEACFLNGGNHTVDGGLTA